MKRSTRSFVDKVLRSGKRLFAHRYDETSNRMRIISLAFVDSQVNKIQIIDCGMEIDDHLQIQDFKLGKSNKLNHVLEIDQRKGEIELGESKEMSLVVDNNDHFDNAKRFGVVYTRKRKRDVLKHDNYDEHHRVVQVYKKRKKKVRVSFESGFDGNCGLKKGPVVFAASCSNESDDNSTNVCRFSCFVGSVLRYLRMTKVFSWGQFSSFLLLEPRSGIYSSAGSRFLQVSTCTTSHGLLKVYGSIHSIPLFTLNFSSLPFFVYIHASLLLKHAFLTYCFIKHLTVNNATNQYLKMPSFCTLERDTPFDILLVATKARSARKRIPRASLFNKLSEKKGWTHVESAVPVPGVREVEGFAEEDYVPFKLPESYISTEADELFRTLKICYPVYDMDSDDERWIRNYSHEFVSESIFEKIIDVFETGIFCSPEVFSEASSAVDWCSGLASKEVLNNVYMYWMTKRKKKRSALVSVFQNYKHKRVIKLKRVKRHFTSAVSRKKRSSRRRARQSFVQRQFDSKKAMLNDEESTKASIKVHETQEAAKRSEEASIVKRQNAQSLMEAADLAVYRATMALRIAEARAAGGSVDLVTVPAFGSFVV